jgi:hypothetical protein
MDTNESLNDHYRSFVLIRGFLVFLVCFSWSLGALVVNRHCLVAALLPYAFASLWFTFISIVISFCWIVEGQEPKPTISNTE